MNFKAVSAVTSKLARPTLKVQKHSPTLLFSAGVVGVVATVVLASRATLKLEEVLEKAQSDIGKANTLEHAEYSEQDRQKDIALVYAKTFLEVTKMYGPAIIVGVASISALAGAHIVLNRRNAALTAAYAALDRGFREYRKRVVDQYGSKKDEEFLFGQENYTISQETDKGTINKVVKGPKGTSIYARVFDESNRNWQRAPGYNQLFVRSQMNYANDLLRSRGHVFLNEVYDMLSMDRSKEGAVVGWTYEGEASGDNYIDFGVFDGDQFSAMRFVNGDERSVILDFNVDGVIYDKI